MQYSTARWFKTGNAPGCPVQTGQIWLFCGAPKATAQLQNSLLAVFSSTWVSNPMITSYCIILTPEVKT
jgi:hypothetical protein